MHKTLHPTLAATALLLALPAVQAADLELFGFFDLMVPLIQRMPLPAYMTADLFWPGLALALVNGVANLVAAVLFARSDGRARSWALLAGALLIVWCVFELVYLPNPVSVIYLVIGLVQTACAVVMRPAR